MNKSFDHFRKPIKEDFEVNTESQDEFVEDHIEMDEGSFRDFTLWLTELSDFEWDHFPSLEIEKRLRGYGYTGYLVDNYIDEIEGETEGEEVIPLYVFSSGEMLNNVVLNVAWIYEEGVYDLDAVVEKVSQEYLDAALSEDDIPEEVDITEGKSHVESKVYAAFVQLYNDKKDYHWVVKSLKASNSGDASKELTQSLGRGAGGLPAGTDLVSWNIVSNKGDIVAEYP